MCAKASAHYLTLAVVALLGAATAHFGGAAQAAPVIEEISKMECPNQFQNYRNTVNWYGTSNQVLIEARHACGDKTASVYDLEEVKLRILSHGKVIATLQAATGLIESSKNKLVVGGLSPLGQSQTSLPCLTQPSILSLDMSTGELKGSRLLIQLNSKKPLRCEVRASS